MGFFKLWLAYSSFGVSVLLSLWIFNSIITVKKYQKLKKEQKEQNEKNEKNEKNREEEPKPPKGLTFDLWNAIKFSLVVGFFPALWHYMLTIL